MLSSTSNFSELSLKWRVCRFLKSWAPMQAKGLFCPRGSRARSSTRPFSSLLCGLFAFSALKMAEARTSSMVLYQKHTRMPAFQIESWLFWSTLKGKETGLDRKQQFQLLSRSCFGCFQSVFVGWNMKRHRLLWRNRRGTQRLWSRGHGSQSWEGKSRQSPWSQCPWWPSHRLSLWFDGRSSIAWLEWRPV